MTPASWSGAPPRGGDAGAGPSSRRAEGGRAVATPPQALADPWPLADSPVVVHRPEGLASVIDGRALADRWEREIARRARLLVSTGSCPDAGDEAAIAAALTELTDAREREREGGDGAGFERRGVRPPSLAVVQVGARPDSCLYVARKAEAAARVGFRFRLISLPETSSTADVVAAVRALAPRGRGGAGAGAGAPGGLEGADEEPPPDGVLVQLPVPDGIDEDAVTEALCPAQDVDGFHPSNVGRLVMRGRGDEGAWGDGWDEGVADADGGDASSAARPAAMGHGAHCVPCAPLGCVEMMTRSHLPLRGRHVVVLGDSNTVGTPLSMLLRDRGAAAVTVVHRGPRLDAVDGGGAGDDDDDETAERRASAGVCLPAPNRRLARRRARAAAAASGGAPAVAGPAAGPDGPAPGFGPGLPALCRLADVLVVAVGEPELVDAAWIKPGAVVLDVGINVVRRRRGAPDAAAAATTGPGSPPDPGDPEHRVVGDVDFDAASRVASVVTPVPGGVGPCTIAALLSNTLEAARARVVREGG